MVSSWTSGMTAQPVVGREPADESTDGHLIEQSWRDGERFAGIFDRHAVAVHRYLTRRVGGSLADDLTAETFLIAFRQRNRYDVGQPDARPWLYGIATNLLRRERRAEVRQYRALARTGVDPVTGPAEEDAAVARVVAEAEHRRIASVLARLPAFSYEEVARALDIPVGTVRSRLHSARKRIRAAMNDFNPHVLKEER